MTTTLAELRADLIDKLGLYADDEMIPTPSLNRAINKGMQQMATEFNWPWLEEYTTISVIADTDEYSLPNDLVQIVAVGDDEGYEELTAVTPRDLMSPEELTGTALYFTKKGANLKIAPKPNKTTTLTVLYIKAENELLSDGDTVLTPDHYSDIIVTYAALYQAVRLKDQQLYQTLDLVRQRWIKTMEKALITTTKVPRIKDVKTAY